MAIRDIPAPKINLNVPPGTVPLTMDMQKFFEFSFWMAEELLDLEARYSNWPQRRRSDEPVESIG